MISAFCIVRESCWQIASHAVGLVCLTGNEDDTTNKTFVKCQNPMNFFCWHCAVTGARKEIYRAVSTIVHAEQVWPTVGRKAALSLRLLQCDVIEFCQSGGDDWHWPDADDCSKWCQQRCDVDTDVTRRDVTSRRLGAGGRRRTTDGKIQHTVVHFMHK